MIAVTNLFISSIKMTVLAHYLMFSLSLQWLTEDYLLPFLANSNSSPQNTYRKQKYRNPLTGPRFVLVIAHRYLLYLF